MEIWRKNLYLIWIAQFIAMMGMSLVVPFLPFFVRELGVTELEEVEKWSGLAFSGPFLVSFFTTPFWGMLGDRYGRKLMVVRAIFGLSISQVLMGFSQNVIQLFFFRMIQGAVSGFIAAALAFVAANTPRDRTGYALGVLQTSTASGNVIGPFVGGALADLFGYRPIFFIVAGLCFVSGTLVATSVKEMDSGVNETDGRIRLVDNYRFAFSLRPLQLAMVAIFLTQFSIAVVQPIFALFVESIMITKEYLATITGAVFGVIGISMVISSPWWGKRNDRRGFKRNLVVAISGASITFALQGLATHPFHLLLLRAVLGFCLGGILPTLYAIISQHSPLARRGGIMGIASSATILGNMVGPVSGGYLAAHIGLRSCFFINGGILLAAAFMVSKYMHETKPSLTEQTFL